MRGPSSLAAGARLNRAVELALIDLDLHQLDEPLQPTVRGEDFEQPLLVLDGDFELRGESVGEVRRVLIAEGGLERVGLHLGGEADVLLDELRGALHESVDAGPRLGRDWSAAHGGGERPVVVLDADGRGALAALDDDLRLAVLLTLGLEDAGDGADAVNLLGRGLVDGGVVLGGEEDRAVGGERVFEGAHRAGPADLEGDLGEGEDYNVADGHHRQTYDVGRRAVRVFFHNRDAALLNPVPADF